jgi:hypothetical protein
VFCQDFPGFGIPKSTEFKMKECDFDKEADAVILVHEAKSDYDDQHYLITHHRIRIRILKENGIRHADIAIPYYSNEGFERITNINGVVFNQNEKGQIDIRSLEKKSIYKKKLNDYYDEMVFAFPMVKVGSIIEYSYTSTMEHYGGLKNWEFQQDIPVVLSKYSLAILPNTEFAYKVQKKDDLAVKIVAEKGSGKISFEMKDIPSLKDEPYMDSRKDNLQMVRFQLAGIDGRYRKKYMTNWDEVTKELSSNSSFGNQIGKSLSGTDDFISSVKLNSSAIEKMNLVFDYVRSNMAWNGFTSKYSENIKQAWNKKSGTNGDINLILITLLKEAGIEASPMLVSERGHGKVQTDYPFVDQFNTVYAYVVVEGKKYYLDATDRLTPSHTIPFSILNTTAYIVNRKAGGIVHIKDEFLAYKDYLNIIGNVSSNGSITGNVFIISKDYARTKRLSDFRKNSSKYINTHFTQGEKMINIDSFEITNDNIDSLPLHQKFKFSAPLSSTGDYSFVPVNLFSDFKVNPFLSDIRFSDINFGYRQSVVMNCGFIVDKAFAVEAIPKPIKLINADKTIQFTRSILYDEKNRRIVGRITIDTFKSLYETAEYSDIKAFYKKMFDLLTEQIVLKKI